MTHGHDTANTRQNHGKHTAIPRQTHGKQQQRHGKATAKTRHKHNRPRPRHGKNMVRHETDTANALQKQGNGTAKPRQRHGTTAMTRQEQGKTRQRHGKDRAKTRQTQGKGTAPATQQDSGHLARVHADGQMSVRSCELRRTTVGPRQTHVAERCYVDVAVGLTGLLWVALQPCRIARPRHPSHLHWSQTVHTPLPRRRAGV